MVPVKVLFITPYPVGESPSQRFRFEQYFGYLTQAGIMYHVSPFLEHRHWRSIYSDGNYIKKAWLMLGGCLRRIAMFYALPAYDFVFIHREALPFGPPVVEWIIAHLFRKKIIYDFDDAIWQTDKINESFLARTIRWRSKVKWICRWSYIISCGNNYLCEYARQFNTWVVKNPTTIDTENVHNPDRYAVREHKAGVVIGWTGSHSTLKYLKELEPILAMILERFPQVSILVIADRDPGLNLPRVQFRPWSKETEITDLLTIDIGVMPLPDDKWSKGKCGFKALQYMALKKPAVVSPVGVNSEIIQTGVNGFICSSEQEWVDTLSRLVVEEDVRRRIGLRGKETVEKYYSVKSNASRFVSFFQL